MESRIHRTVFALVAIVACCFDAVTVAAQSVCLPSPRLLTTTPAGGQIGTDFELTITGQHIEDAEELRFSTPAISAKPKTDSNGNPVPNTYVISVAADCPPGLHDARVMTRLGISSARAFHVDRLPEVVRKEPNTSLESAMSLSIDSICNAVMSVKSIDHYRFRASEGQRLSVDCAARGIDSKLNPVLIVGDEEGRDLVVQRRGDAIEFLVPADGEYTIKVHDLTFKGGSAYFYRLALRELDANETLTRMPTTRAVGSFSWPPHGLSSAATQSESDPEDPAATPQKIDLPCDIAGRFYPAADVDVFEFEAKKGELWWVEVASHRLGLPTDPSVVVQRVDSDGDNETLTDIAELSDIVSPVKVSSNGYSYDGPPYDAGSSDVLGKFEIAQDGKYRLQVTDLFGGTRSDPRNRYRLIIRKAAPDFAIVAWAMHMNLRNGDRNALSKPIALRRGATMPLEVVVIRRDGFDGEIELEMTDLPDGVTASGLKIPAGQSRGTLLVTADPGAPRGVSNATLTGNAIIGNQRETRTCRLASMAWPVPNAWSEVPAPRLLADLPVSVGGFEVAPITITPREKKVWSAAMGEKLTIPLIHMRRSEFSGATISMKTFGAGFEKTPAFEIPLTADSSEAVLDLARLKTPPGEYLIAFYGSAVVKHRHNVDAIGRAEQAQRDAQQHVVAATAESKKLAEHAKSASETSKPAAIDLAKAAAAKEKLAKAQLAAATKRLQAAINQAKPKDTADIIVSEPIAIRVKPAIKK